MQSRLFALAFLMITQHVLTPATVNADVEWKDGKPNYTADERGNRIVDFSYAGYRAGERPIPLVEARVTIGNPAADNTRLLQAAIDEVSTLAPNADGHRGAVLIPPGEYAVAGSLNIQASGVVVRGSGSEPGGTTLIASGKDRRTVIELNGKSATLNGSPQSIVDTYVPVNAISFRLQKPDQFSVGDMIRIVHPCTPEWISKLEMNDFGGDRHGPSWRPNSREIHWVRQVVAVNGDQITIDAPLTLAIDSEFGQATVAKLNTDNWISESGVENLRIVSTYDPSNDKDEEHAWFGVGMNHARDSWVRRVTCENLSGSAVAVWESCSRITVEDCQNLHPVGEIGGLRRQSFFVSGQQVLMQRLYSESGYHDFAIGLTAAGPNAFVQCESTGSLDESGCIDSAACGSLFDRVRIDGHNLSLRNRTYQGQGVGWSSFNGVLWNSTASVIVLQKPPTAQNWAFGTHGEYDGNGKWVNSDDNVAPESLYYAQLAERIGQNQADERAQLILPSVQGSRASSPAQAAEASQISMQPRMRVDRWSQQIMAKHPLEIDNSGLPLAKLSETLINESKSSPKSVAIENGWITVDGQVAVGGELNVPWWNGGLRRDDIAKANRALTRFVPGRTGVGLTDDIHSLVDSMSGRGENCLIQYPPLWYERRRDDHSRVQRKDGDVVGPFYETPWARSGVGTAYDGLSKWDVTKANHWYFERLRQFSRLGAEKGMFLFNGLYMQHSVLEAGAHYADAPWRSANNINSINLPEPVFYAGDKLIYIAEQFYDVKDPGRAQAHRAYMRSVLEELKDEPNVIFFLSEEYTGPLEFVQFWLDVVAEWKLETGNKPIIALYATKDVTDAILADPKRATTVSIIYSRYNGDGWWYAGKDKLYAPPGGQNLSPRQWTRHMGRSGTGFDGVHRMVREYRLAHPDKPFVYQGSPELAWAAVLGGGSLASLPTSTDPDLLQAIARMKPTTSGIGLEDGQGNKLTFSDELAVDTRAQSIDTGSGERTKANSRLKWIRNQGH